MQKIVFFILFSLLILNSTSVYAGAEVDAPAEEEKTENDPIPEIGPLPEYFNKDVKHPLGVRPDCSEKPVTINDLEKIAKDPKSTDIVGFLNNLPQDSFQTFTLVTNSKSAQRCDDGPGQVSEEWPRVLRTSADGKITFSYTCNPKSCAYNKVEVIYYDDNGNEMKTMSIDLNQKPEKRSTHNDGKCVACHGTVMPDGKVSIKPIWPEYFQWGGCEGQNTINLYGSNDDNMYVDEFRTPFSASKEYNACSVEAIKEKRNKEILSFQKFKENNLGVGDKNNPCYSSLPWAKPTGEEKGQYDPKKYGNYPYSTNKDDTMANGNSDGKENYYLRPNLKFTEMYSRLNAKRISGIIEKSPDFPKIRYFLALEAAGCLKEEDQDLINKVLPGMNYTYKAKDNYGNGPADPKIASPLLYDYSKYIGLKDGDWSLEFKATESKYTAAIPRKSMDAPGGASYDMGIAEVAGGQILTSIAKTDPEVEKVSKDAFTRGAAESFGAQWSCIDDLGGAVREGFQGPKRPLCTTLRNSLNSYLTTINIDPCIKNDSPLNELEGDVKNVKVSLDETKVNQGQNIAEGRCLKCHGPNQKNATPFLPAKGKKLDETGRAKLSDDYFKSLDYYLDEDIMPADESPRLTSDEKMALKQYMQSLRN